MSGLNSFINKASVTIKIISTTHMQKCVMLRESGEERRGSIRTGKQCQ